MTTSRRWGSRRFPVLLLGLLCLTLAACSGGASSPPTGGASTLPVGTFLDKALDPSVLALPLTDERGSTTSLTALAGKTIVLTDFLTTCQEISPMTSVNVRAAAEAATADHASKVEFLEITVDPGRDDVRRLAAYKALYGSESNWHLLTAGAAVTRGAVEGARRLLRQGPQRRAAPEGLAQWEAADVRRQAPGRGVRPGRVGTRAVDHARNARHQKREAAFEDAHLSGRGGAQQSGLTGRTHMDGLRRSRPPSLP